jgi:hypothetical protein
LSAAGEKLFLSDGASYVLDEVTFGQQAPDVTFGRYPNGTGAFTFMPPTFNAVNSLTIKTSEAFEQGALRVFPNPSSGAFSLRSDFALGNLRVLNALGQPVYTEILGNATEAMIHLENLPVGIYVIQTESGARRVVKR